MNAPLYKDHFTQRQQQNSNINNAVRSTVEGEASNNFVYQTKKNVPALDSLASSNYYYELALKQKKAREDIASSQQHLF